MWLPRPLYEAKPWASVALGVAAFVAAWRAQGLAASAAFVAGGALVTYGTLLWIKRRDYRRSQAAYDPRLLEDDGSSAATGAGSPPESSAATSSSSEESA
jgi:hypothetical protein